MTALKPFIVFVAIIVTWLIFTLTVNFGVPFLERHLFGMPESEYIWIGCNSNLDDFSSGTPCWNLCGGLRRLFGRVYACTS